MRLFNSLKLALLICFVAMLYGCAAKQSLQQVKINNDFSPSVYAVSPEDKATFAKLQLEYMAGDRDFKFDWYVIKSNPEAAKYFLDKDIASKTRLKLNHALSMRAIAMETLLESGDNTYFNEYWKYANDPSSQVSFHYSLDFITKVAMYHAGKGDPDFQLFITKAMAFKNEKNLAREYYIDFVVNPRSKAQHKVDLALEVGNHFFDKKDFSNAAQWYSACINAYLNNQDEILAARKNEAFVIASIQSRFGYNKTINEIISKLEKSERHDLDHVKERLGIIRDAGYSVIPISDETDLN
ncbi:hypothetical protein [Maridesulfovibrio sp. FT414]|uniref:hypothetical protein n=1 Tax=Maridesulfovibrio sp. FT414 TaxID=2979469 RepID=UPI003D808A9A